MNNKPKGLTKLEDALIAEDGEVREFTEFAVQNGQLIMRQVIETVLPCPSELVISNNIETNI